MLASRCAMAAVIILSLSWYIAVRPFGEGATSTASPRDDAGQIEDALDIIGDQFDLGEIEGIHAPEGETTFVIRRDDKGQPVFSIAQPDGSTTTTDDLEGLRQQLERARDDAVNALEELESARTALETAQSVEQTQQRLQEESERIAELAQRTTELRFQEQEGFDADRIEALLEDDTLIEDRSSEIEELRSEQSEAELARPPAPVQPIEDRAAENRDMIADPLETPPEAPTATETPGSDDFAGEVLIGRDFSGMDLRGVDFRRSILTGAIFDGADLRKADFRGAKLQATRFNKATLIDADLSGATAQGAYFANADLRRANLENTNLTGTTLTGADLRGANTRKTIMTGAVKEGAKFGDDPRLPLQPASSIRIPDTP